jgi:hypothetical protein
MDRPAQSTDHPVRHREGATPMPGRGPSGLETQTVRAAIEGTARRYTPSDWCCPDRYQHSYLSLCIPFSVPRRIVHSFSRPPIPECKIEATPGTLYAYEFFLISAPQPSLSSAPTEFATTSRADLLPPPTYCRIRRSWSHHDAPPLSPHAAQGGLKGVCQCLL